VGAASAHTDLRVTSLFLGCFAFGLIFTVASFLIGALDGSHIHLPGFNLQGGHQSTGMHPAAGHGALGSHGSGSGITISPFNLTTGSAFLTWFGGAGYLLSRYSGLTTFFITLIATTIGLAGGGLVFVAVARLLLPRLTEMRPEDYRLEGAVAKVTASIRPGGTGEIVFTLGGSQKIESARGLADDVLDKGTEVVIHHVAGGIAYVERWDKFAEQNALPPGPMNVS
jgi:membrane protein implicated in regulation of membrane protease activity